jgi:GxxExxY protein
MIGDPFTYAVIGKAMQVHRELGPGVEEVFYHDLLSQRLKEANIKHESRPRGRLAHRGILADIFEADLLFPGRLVAELKSLRGAFDPEHYVQLICCSPSNLSTPAPSAVRLDPELWQRNARTPLDHPSSTNSARMWV